MIVTLILRASLCRIASGGACNRRVAAKMTIEDIQNAIRAGRVRITDHADEEAAADGLSYDEIEVSVLAGGIIEEYQTLRPYPSCLVCGPAADGGWVHSVWAYNASNRWPVLVTVYRADPSKWLDGRERRRSN